ncbi:MAG: helix-turn-helix domain-containing protein [Clostridiales bacterium]|nr:helix-turn-helix domain-containing protein [Clostridiales bacterium]
MNLLMVNDAVAAVNAMTEQIDWKQYGISHVFVAYNVEEGKTVIREQSIDVLLCDIEMPGEYGISLIRWIRENKYEIECVLLTCHADFAYAQEAVILGCQDYVLLPASYETIGNTVQKVVERHRERQKNSRLQEYGKSWLRSKEERVAVPPESQKTPKDVVADCVNYIVDNLGNENLSVNEIASHFYLSPIYLNRIFKKEQGIAISQYIIREKMTLAAELLKQPGSSATAVAIQVGYPNYPYFSTLFKKYYACTPSQYREKYEDREK